MDKKEVRKKIAANIRAERARAKLLQEEVADAIGVNRKTYIRYEEEATMNVDTLYLIALKIGCKVSDFYLGINITEREVD